MSQAKIHILFEDNDLLVLDKPEGLVVNRSETTPENTVQDFIEHHKYLDINDPSSEFAMRSGIVHRIDKDTSGLLLIARNEYAFNAMKDQFKQRKVLKEYTAIVLGKFNDPKVEINAPIKRDHHNRMRMSVSSDGREAITSVSLVKNFNIQDLEVALLKVYPKTGRTHQIRVHLCALNHPIVGDPIYSTEKQLMSERRFFNRLMLHAGKIMFTHPTTNIEVSFEAPVPNDFVDFKNLLES